jgi:hypothetical protein
MSNEKTLATTQGFDLSAGLSDFQEYKAKSGETVVGLEKVDVTDMKLPKIRLLQSNSLEVTKGGMKAGQFYNTVTKKAVDKMTVILLALGKSRVMWPEKFKRGDEPLCRSFDNVKSFDGTKLCAKCPYADWDKAKEEGKNKPDCNMSYVWMGIDLANRTLFRQTMGGMSVGPTKDFINQIAPNRLPAFVYHTEISSKQEENENGVFHVAQYNIVGVIAKDEFKQLEDMATGMQVLFDTAIKKDTLQNDESSEEAGATNTTNGALF